MVLIRPSYDFGDGILLGTAFSFTRIGADYLTTDRPVGRSAATEALPFAVQIVPRISAGHAIGL